MRDRRFSLCAAAVIVALATSGVAAREVRQGGGETHPPAPFPVRLSGLPAEGDVQVALLAGSIGKTATTKADSKGEAQLALESVSIGKAPQRAEVYVDECPGRKTNVWIVDEGAVPPADDTCKRRRLGAFWLNRSRGVNVNLTQGAINALTRGMSTRTRAILVGIGAGVGVLVLVATLGGGNGTTHK